MMRKLLAFVSMIVAGGTAAVAAESTCVAAEDFFGGKKPHVVNVGPKESLFDVRDRVRAMSANEKANGVEIRLAPARYELGKTLLLRSGDSGAPGAPVVWRGAPNGGTVLTMGRDSPVERFKSDPARPGVLVADVSDWRPAWPERPTKEWRGPYPIPEVYVDGERFTIAGWPDWPTVSAPGDTNGGWSVVAKFVDMGTRYGSDRKFYDCNSHRELAKMTVVDAPWPGTFGYSGDRPSRWTDAKSMVLQGFWTFDWSETKIPAKSIDTASRTIALAYPHEFGLRPGNPSPRRWRAFNLLEELDRPGEYFVDTEKNLVYIIPRRPLVAGTRVTVTWMTGSVITMRGVSNVAFSDMELFGSWANGVDGEGTTNVVFRGMEIHGMRIQAFQILAAHRCRISGTHIYDTGSGGILLSGGDRRTLTRGRNVVEDCLIHDFSKNALTSRYGICMDGCGNVARHNEMFGALHQVASLKGNDNLFEYNVISNAVKGTDDAGAYYTGRDPSCRGNLIRYNYFSDIGTDRGHGTAAIYFDDGDGGNMVFGCVFERCGAGGFGAVFSHGGYSNVVQNCLFIDCKRPFGSGPWDQKKWEDFLKLPYMVKRLKLDVDIESPTYLARYPELKGYLPGQADELRWNSATCNVFVNANEVLKGRWVTNETDVAVKELPPGDRNAACAAIVPGFKPIPYEKIGRRTKKSNW